MKANRLFLIAIALCGLWSTNAAARGFHHVHTEFGVYLGDPYFWGPRPWPYYYDVPRTVIIERSPPNLPCSSVSAPSGSAISISNSTGPF